MSDIFPEPFSEALLPEVSDFYCGDEVWEKEVAEWIVGTGTAEPKLISLLKAGQTEAWIYRNESGEIVGYAALTKLRWNVEGEWIKTTLLQACGLRQFQGKPDAEGTTKYSKQIMSDLAAKAIEYGRPIWGLFVHRNNVKAMRFYRSCGFLRIEEPRETYYRMFVDLSDEIGSPQ